MGETRSHSPSRPALRLASLRATVAVAMSQALPRATRTALTRPTLTLRQLLALSDFARASPARADELLARAQSQESRDA